MFLAARMIWQRKSLELHSVRLGQRRMCQATGLSAAIRACQGYIGPVESNSSVTTKIATKDRSPYNDCELGQPTLSHCS